MTAKELMEAITEAVAQPGMSCESRVVVFIDCDYEGDVQFDIGFADVVVSDDRLATGCVLCLYPRESE